MDFRPETASFKGRKIIFLLLAVTVLLALSAIFLPPGLIRLAVSALLISPVIFVLFDKPEWTFYLLLFLLFSNLHIFSDLPVTRSISILLIITFLTACIKGRNVLVHDRLFLLMTLAFLILAFQSMALSRDIDSSIYRISLFIRYLIYIFFVIQFSSTRREFITILCVIAFASAISNFLPFILPPPDKFADLSLMWEEGVFRYEGYEREANMFAFTLNFIIPILFLVFARFRRPWFIRPLATAAIGGSIFVLFLSFSRGGFIGLVFMFLALFIIERKNKAVISTGLILIAAGAILAPYLYWDRISSILDVGSRISEDFSILSRLETIRISLILGVKNPLFGLGIGSFLFSAARYVPFSDVVHNSLLQVFAEMGSIALAVLSVIIIYNFKVIKKLIDRRDDPEAAQVGRVLFIQHAAVLANSMTLPVAFNMVFWFTLVLPTVAWYVYSGRSRLAGNSMKLINKEDQRP
ncbi:MAG: O-antigen ligase family protein [Candidatus Krumholzibacteriota bacterium]|nr:O-antigen ligase family protein [Candidatus Krumholzibacteriota bacterium]